MTSGSRLRATSPPVGYKLSAAQDHRARSISMTVLRWLCLGLASLTCFSGQADAARALSGTGSPPAAPATQRPAAQPPAGQVTETRIAAVVNDEVISVADVMSRLRMVML